MVASLSTDLLALQKRISKEGLSERSVSTSKVHSVDWSCDGRHLASGSLDKTISIFSASPDRLSKEQTYKGHTDSVDQIAWHPTDPELLASASGDKTVRIWDARIGKSIANISTKGENINISWAKDGKTIAVGNKEDLVSFIDVKSYCVIKEEQFKFEVNEIAFSPNSDLFFLTNGQGCINIYTFPEMKLEHVIQAHPGNCLCIEFDPTGEFLAVGGADALVSLWDVQSLACVRTFSRPDWPVRAISFSHDGKMIASASEDLVIDIGHVQTGGKVFGLSVPSPTFSVAWHPKRYILAYGCDDKEKYDRDRDSCSLKIAIFSEKDEK